MSRSDEDCLKEPNRETIEAMTAFTSLKILIIGQSNVGKSCLLLRFVDDTYEEATQATIGMDTKSKLVEVNGEVIRLRLWDTAGTERYRNLTPSFYRGAQGVVLVYDITNRKSFEELSNWNKEVNLHTTPDIVRMLVGNKVDKEGERAVTKREGIDYARRNGMLFVETSARTSLNVVNCFDELVAKILSTQSLWQRESPQDGAFRLTERDDRAQPDSSCYC